MRFATTFTLIGVSGRFLYLSGLNSMCVRLSAFLGEWWLCQVKIGGEKINRIKPDKKCFILFFGCIKGLQKKIIKNQK